MAYNKKTWKARQGLGLNKFSIDGATPVPVINQPDSVTQQGDALSAGNLNDLEQRIADAFDDVEESKADKSTTEALQSQINQQEARLNQHDARLQNLEQKAGDYTTVQYRGTDAVPTGKAKNGLVEKIVGKTRAWNQILPPSAQGSTVVNDVTIASDGNGAYTLNGTASSYIYTTIKSNFQNDMAVGHKYLILCNSPSGNVYLADSYSNKFDVNAAAIFDYTTSDTIWIGLHVRGGVTVNETVKPMVRDLTLIFGSGNEPSTVADALAQLPALGQYNAYDAGSLVDTEVSGVEAIGFNRLDLDTYMTTLEISKSGDYYVATATVFNNKSAATPFPVSFKPNTQYSFRLTGYCASGLSRMELSVLYTDGTSEALAKNASSSLATATGTSTIGKSISSVTFSYGSGGSNNFYLKSICISEGTDTVTDLPYKKSTLSLSEPVTLRSAGTCVETLDVETGVLDDGKFGLKNLGDYDWTQTGTGKFIVNDSDVASNMGADVVPNIVCTKYSIITPAEQYQETKTGITTGGNGVGTAGQIRVYDASFTGDATAFKTAMSGVYLLYEKATYTPSSPIAPITDNFIEVEGGGTVETIQTQTPVIDNCLDMGYLTV